MNKRISAALLFLLMAIGVKAQTIQSPDEFLGYPLGSRFTPHYKVLAYFDYVSKNSAMVKLQKYGETYEHRPLEVAIVASNENSSKIEEIRNNNLKLAGVQEGEPSNSQPVIVWLSYNVHGNEAVSTETSMKVLFELVNPSNAKTKQWLKNTIVIMDPCLNPDGRERYVNFYTERVGKNPNMNLATREHQEPWPGGRPNHYLFDLNRDWAWQTQQETQYRMALYNKWLPQVHVDFHEMGINEPYFFAPAAAPYHEALTQWQRDFQVQIGKNNAMYFDQNNWLYFTKEVFDLFYPSYGDTYPMFNGAIGMTFEQGGSGRAGLGVITREGDTLTLKNRIDHHFTTSLSTIEVASTNADKAVKEFKNYFASAKTSPKGQYKSYIIKGANSAKINDFAKLLDKNGIEYGYGSSVKSASGFNYITGKVETFSIDKTDLVINTYQPKSVFINVLFDAKPKLADSITYDLTSWALPYSWGLNAYASAALLKPAVAKLPIESAIGITVQPVAYLCEWNSVASARFLSALLQDKVSVRFAETAFELNGKSYAPGTLIITRAGNQLVGNSFDKLVKSAAQTTGVQIDMTLTGFVSKGADFGSSSVHMIKAPKVAVLMGDDVSENAFGEVWHFFEQQLNYPVDVVQADRFDRLKLTDYDVLILPNGTYSILSSDRDLSKLRDWARGGGRVIAMENAVAQLAGKAGFSLKQKTEDTDTNSAEKGNMITYSSRSRNDLSENSIGSIYKIKMDNTHPLGFGYTDTYFSLRQDINTYQLLPKGNWNVGVIGDNGLVSGFVGYKAKSKLKNTLIFGVEEVGAGQFIYMADNPIFRSFWESGKVLFSNAVFLVGQE
ncbi:M14 family metallopeptidase [Solitalea sp. MAHUQ-68]|uniref:M14 family metallopeptidase n=1 Tax=Solitalea agri TaxID=2953739 RepID=A0A9X2EZJ1_9SPHI|nr:M14 family metallopeptidase [Solitalea agri]MCO4291290.1 M14 family metallopeptidase [Solitalea agri]